MDFLKQENFDRDSPSGDINLRPHRRFKPLVWSLTFENSVPCHFLKSVIFDGVVGAPVFFCGCFSYNIFGGLLLVVIY